MSSIVLPVLVLSRIVLPVSSNGLLVSVVSSIVLPVLVLSRIVLPVSSNGLLVSVVSSIVLLVSAIMSLQDVLKLMTQLLREVDNAIGLSKLCGAPDMLSDGQMVCRDQFLVYTTRGKKRKVHTMSVFLHPSKVVFARTRKEERRKESTYLEFYEALEV